MTERRDLGVERVVKAKDNEPRLGPGQRLWIDFPRGRYEIFAHRCWLESVDAEGVDA